MFFFNRISSLSTRELAEKLPQKPLILDVREPYEFASGHIPGAKNVPLGKIGSYKTDKPVYVICQSGMRSKRAAKQLQAKGIDVTNVSGGMSSWSGPIKGGKQ